MSRICCNPCFWLRLISLMLQRSRLYVERPSLGLNLNVLIAPEVMTEITSKLSLKIDKDGLWTTKHFVWNALVLMRLLQLLRHCVNFLFLTLKWAFHLFFLLESFVTFDQTALTLLDNCLDVKDVPWTRLATLLLLVAFSLSRCHTISRIGLLSSLILFIIVSNGALI